MLMQNALPVRRIHSLLEEQQGLNQAGLAGAVGSEKNRYRRKADATGFFSCLKIVH